MKTIHHDPTWEHPSEEQMAALEWARARRPTGYTDVQAVDLILTAKDSLWYSQAQQWVEHPPEQFYALGAETVRHIFVNGLAFVVELVDLGYDAERRAWWPFEKIPNFQEKLILFGMTMSVISRVRVSTGMVISSGFEFLACMILGNNWKYQVEKALNHVISPKGKQGG